MVVKSTPLPERQGPLCLFRIGYGVDKVNRAGDKLRNKAK